MVRRVLHVSNSPYGSIATAGPTRAIWEALAAGAEAYHVLAPHAARRFGTDREDGLVLHQVPNLGSRAFALQAYGAAALVARHRIDGMLCQDPLLGGLACVHVGRALRVPVMVELHTDRYFALADSRRPGDRVLGRLALAALRGASRVRASTGSSRTELERRGVDPGRIVELGYRVDTRFFCPDAALRAAERARLGVRDDEVLAVSVGRFVAQKGYLELLEPFKAARARAPGLRLVLAGGGRLEDELRAAVDRAGLGEAVLLRGWITREEQRALMAAADVYLQPSRSGLGEWMPRTILEAMAMALPVVATRVGGIADVVEGERTGRVVGDAAGACAALVELAGDAGLRRALGVAGRRRAEDAYEWDAAFAAYRSALYGMAR